MSIYFARKYHADLFLFSLLNVLVLKLWTIPIFTKFIPKLNYIGNIKLFLLKFTKVKPIKMDFLRRSHLSEAATFHGSKIYCANKFSSNAHFSESAIIFIFLGWSKQKGDSLRRISPYVRDFITSFYAPPQKVAGYYVIPSEPLSVFRLSVRPSVSGLSFMSAP